MSNSRSRLVVAPVGVQTDPAPLEARLRRLGEQSPPRPVALGALERLGLCDASVDSGLALRSVRDALCGGAPGEILGRIWSEAVVAGVHAETIANRCGFDAAAAGLAGLLHRAGELLCLGELEAMQAGRWCTPDVRRLLVGQYEGAANERLVRCWSLSPVCGAALLGWRRFGMHGRSAREAMAVYLARVLALETMRPELCAPGIGKSVAADLGLDDDDLAHVRGRVAPLLARLLQT